MFKLLKILIHQFGLYVKNKQIKQKKTQNAQNTTSYIQELHQFKHEVFHISSIWQMFSRKAAYSAAQYS